MSQPASQASATSGSAAAVSVAGPSFNLRMGLAVVGAIVLIYVVARVSSFLSGPVGGAIKTLFGTAGAILSFIAGLPPWLLVGLGLAYLLGPSVLRLAGLDTATLAKGLKTIRAKFDDYVKSGATPEEAKAMADAAVTQANQNLRDNIAGREGADADALERAERAADARSTARAAARTAGPEAAAADEAGEELGDEAVEIDGFGRWARMLREGRKSDYAPLPPLTGAVPPSRPPPDPTVAPLPGARTLILGGLAARPRTSAPKQTHAARRALPDAETVGYGDAWEQAQAKEERAAAHA